jgi:hypothetical protein
MQEAAAHASIVELTVDAHRPRAQEFAGNLEPQAQELARRLGPLADRFPKSLRIAVQLRRVPKDLEPEVWYKILPSCISPTFACLYLPLTQQAVH